MVTIGETLIVILDLDMAVVGAVVITTIIVTTGATVGIVLIMEDTIMITITIPIETISLQ